MKHSNDTIRNQTRNLPSCSAVPQPTALPRAPMKHVTMTKNISKGNKKSKIVLFIERLPTILGLWFRASSVTQIKHPTRCNNQS